MRHPDKQDNLLYRARVTIVKKIEFVKGVPKLIKTKQTPRAAGADVYRGFGDALDPLMFARVR